VVTPGEERYGKWLKEALKAEREPVKVMQQVGMVHTRVFKTSGAGRLGKRLHGRRKYF
jgi:hypothetical protein